MSAVIQGLNSAKKLKPGLHQSPDFNFLSDKFAKKQKFNQLIFYVIHFMVS